MYSLRLYPIMPQIEGGSWTSEGCRSRLLIGVWLAGWLAFSLAGAAPANIMAEKVMEEFAQRDGGEGYGPTCGIRSSFFSCIESVRVKKIGSFSSGPDGFVTRN